MEPPKLKTKSGQNPKRFKLRKDMIGAPEKDLCHKGHIGCDGALSDDCDKLPAAGGSSNLSLSLFPDGQCRLILIGKTGNGKSSTGNSILGYEAFKPQVGINAGTRHGDLHSVKRGDVDLQVMDTPGLHDTEVNDDVIAERITRSLLAMHPGPHAIILCLSCDQRFTSEEVKVFEALKDIFGTKMPSYLIVVFTRRDALEKQDASFEEQLTRSTGLQKVLAEANNRYVLFDNRPELSENKKRRQVDKLLDKVKEVVEQNEGNFFRHELSEDFNQSMKALRRAELDMIISEIDLNPEDMFGQVTEQFEKATVEESCSDEDGNSLGAARGGNLLLSQTIIAMSEKKVVKEARKQFESGMKPKAPELSREELASKFKLRAAKDVNTSRRKCPVPSRLAQPPPSRPSSRHQDSKQAGIQPRQELIKRSQDISKPTTTDDMPPPRKPRRTHLHGEKKAKDDRELIQQFEVKPAADEPIRKPVSIVYEVPDRPGMRRSQKQRMVDEALKRKLARGMEGLNQEQTEELEKTSKSLGKKIREGMKKFAVEKIGACRIM